MNDPSHDKPAESSPALPPAEMTNDDSPGEPGLSPAAWLLARAGNQVREHGLHTVPVDRALVQLLRHATCLQWDVELAAEANAAGTRHSQVRYEVLPADLPEEIAGEVGEEEQRQVGAEFLVRAAAVALARAVVGDTPDAATHRTTRSHPAGLTESPDPLEQGRAVAERIDTDLDPEIAAGAAYGFVLAQPRPSSDAAVEEWIRRLRFVGAYHQLIGEAAAGRARARTIAGAWALFCGHRSLFDDVYDAEIVDGGTCAPPLAGQPQTPVDRDRVERGGDAAH